MRFRPAQPPVHPPQQHALARAHGVCGIAETPAARALAPRAGEGMLSGQCSDARRFAAGDAAQKQVFRARSKTASRAMLGLPSPAFIPTIPPSAAPFRSKGWQSRKAPKKKTGPRPESRGARRRALCFNAPTAEHEGTWRRRGGGAAARQLSTRGWPNGAARMPALGPSPRRPESLPVSRDFVAIFRHLRAGM